MPISAITRAEKGGREWGGGGGGVERERGEIMFYFKVQRNLMDIVGMFVIK